MNFIIGVFLLLLTWASSAQAEEFTLSSDKALALHISPQGFAQIGEAVSSLLPTSITISEGSSSFSCSDDTVLDYTLSDLDVSLSIDQTEFVTTNGVISLGIYGTLSSSLAQLTAQGDCSIFSDLSESCDVKIPTTSFSLGMDISLAFVNNDFVVDVGDAEFAISPITNPVGGCLLSDVVDTILGQNPDLINNLIIDAVEPELASLPQTIQDSLEDALDELNFSTEVDLLGTILELSITPSMIQVDERGVILGLSGAVGGELPETHCMDTTSIPEPEGADWPSFDGSSLQSSLTYDIGLFLSKHLFDEVMYGAWLSGALCLDVEELAGLAFTGEFAASFFGEALNDLVGPKPIQLLLQAQKPPTIQFDDDQPPVALLMDGFALKVLGPVEERLVRVLQVDMAANVGIKIDLQGDTLGMETALTSDDFTLTEGYSELMPAGFSQNVPNLLDLALGNFLNEFPSFYIPSFLGVSIGPLVWEPSADQQWQGGYLFIDTTSVTPLSIPGCSASELACDGGGSSIEIDIEDQLGCDEAQAGCSDDTGCSTKGKISLPTGRIFGLFLVLFGALLRRRTTT